MKYSDDIYSIILNDGIIKAMSNFKKGDTLRRTSSLALVSPISSKYFVRRSSLVVLLLLIIFAYCPLRRCFPAWTFLAHITLPPGRP